VEEEEEEAGKEELLPAVCRAAALGEERRCTVPAGALPPALRPLRALAGGGTLLPPPPPPVRGAESIADAVLSSRGPATELRRECKLARLPPGMGELAEAGTGAGSTSGAALGGVGSTRASRESLA
jgi:hypothetical protein